MQSASALDNREVRHFELEADRRARRVFVTIVIVFAILAVAGGIFAAYLLLDDGFQDPTPTVAKPKPPEPVEELASAPVAFRDDDPPKRAPVVRAPKLAETIGDGDLQRGMARLQAALDECAAKHGAIDQTVVHIDFSIGEGGRVSDSAARPPFGKTPLGQCVAAVVKSKGTFPRTRLGRRDIRWAITLHR